MMGNGETFNYFFTFQRNTDPEFIKRFSFRV